MINGKEKLLLVGDNPFHNISHLSQERARERTEDPGDPKYAASLIMTALDNGANGFTFSVSETTLSILKELKERDATNRLALYPVVPYAFEYVRLATYLGGIPGLAKKVGRDMIASRNVSAMWLGLKGFVTTEPAAILKTYLSYELSRVKSSAGKKAKIESVLLHQLITDMSLALDLDWLFKSYIDYLESRDLTPGFNTGNFAFLVHKFADWGIDINRVVVAAPFNKLGFQVTPSVEECEKALQLFSEPSVIAISILAAGYIQTRDAADYIATLPNIMGVAVGVSKEKHAVETFKVLKETLTGTFDSSN